MEATIHHLHCRYRAVGPGGIPAGVTSRLDALVRSAVEGRCHEALETALGDDPAVYILRGVRCNLSMWIGGVSGDRKASTWGYQMASAVVQEIAADGTEEGGLVRFADEPDFIAHFLVDYLDGHAWEHWFYFPFGHLRALDPPGVIVAVIEANRPDLPAILGRLHRLGAVEKLLRQGGPGIAAALMGGLDFRPVEAFLPLAHAALLVAERLDLWKNRAGPRTAAELAALLPAPPVDWRDPRGLAAALLAALRFLYHRGDLRRAALTPPEIDAALRDLDWLDRAWLRESLAEVVAGPTQPVARPAGGPTPRQRRLLDDLLAVLRDPNLRLYAGQGAAETAVRLAAALYAAFPEWQGDGLAEAMLARVARAAAHLAALPGPLPAAHGLAWGSIETAAARLPEGARAELLADLHHLRGLGDPAAELVEHLLPGADATPLPGVECPQAGVALLFRSLLDARFPALANRLSRDHPALAGDTARAGLLLGLFQRLAALPPGEEILLPGWAELAGVPPEDAVRCLRAVRGWLAARAGMLEFQTWLVDTMISLRVLEPSTLRITRIGEPGGRMFLTAGDGTLAVMGAVCGPEDAWSAAAGWVEQFAAVWASAGQPVAPSTADAWLLEHVPGLTSTTEHEPPVLAELAALGVDIETTAAPDLALALAAGGLLRLWARWLPNFSASSAGYLLDQFIHRPGLLARTGDGWLLAMQARPLDLLLEMAGYLSPLEGVPWLDHRTITFQARERL